MKIKIILLLILVNLKVEAQVIQSFNKDYSDNLKKKTIIQSDSYSVDFLKLFEDKENTTTSEYDQFLELKNKTVDPNMAFELQKKCSVLIDTLIIKRKNLIKSEKDIDSLNEKSIHISNQIKELKKVRDYLGAVNSLNGSPKIFRRFFPLRTVEQARMFYLESTDGEKKLTFVKDVSYQNNFVGSNTLNSSILTAVFPLFTRFAPLKVNVASTISQNNDTITQNKVADKIAKGGLFNIGLTYTLLFSNWKYLDENAVVIYLPIEMRYHIDDVKNGVDLNDSYSFNEVSASLYTSFDLIQNKQNADLATLFFAGKLSYFNGSSKFSEKLDENKFSLFQLNVGLKIAKKFTIAANVPIGSSSKTFLNTQITTLTLVFETGN